MKNTLQPERCAVLLRALAEPMRLRIIHTLFGGPACVTDLANKLAVHIQDVSHHLAVLLQGGIVAREKQGRYVVYQLAPEVCPALRSEGGSERLDLGCCSLVWPPRGHPATEVG